VDRGGDSPRIVLDMNEPDVVSVRREGGAPADLVTNPASRMTS
jgi:hypothetical protein